MKENMLDYLRIALYATLAALGFFLFQAWEKEHPKFEPTTITQAETPQAGRILPEMSTAQSSAPTTAVASQSVTAPAVPPSVTGDIIKVTTDVMEVSIDTHGGDIVQVNLLKYPESLNSKSPFLLLNDNPKTKYIAESGLLSQQGPDTTKDQALYKAEHASYTLEPGQNDVTVKLHWEKNGIDVVKSFTFARDSYEVKMAYDLANKSTKPWQGNLYTQLIRANAPPENHGGFINLTTYFGAAVSTPKKPFEKITFKQMQEGNLSQTVKDGWAAMVQHYFISAWIPPKSATSTYYSRVSADGLYSIGMIGEPINIAPGATASAEAKLFAGPAIADKLEKAAPGLKLTIDYGWFWFISDIIFWLMQKIHDVVGNWGWSIVLVTVIIKILFFHLSAKSYRSMSGMKKLQPKIEQLKQRYGDDKQKLTQATLELYRTEKVNPMSGCLPILIQIPVFIALYWVLVESVQLRQAPWILWIHDLTQQDPYYILPLLMGISMFVQQKLNPPPPDPMQAKLMMLMPVIFTVMFANFPAGLMLYWFVNNTLSVLQQWYIMRSVNGESKK